MPANQIVLTKCVPTWAGVNLPVGVVLTAPPEVADRLVASGYARYVATEPEAEPEPESEAEPEPEPDDALLSEDDLEWELASDGDDEEADDTDES